MLYRFNLVTAGFDFQQHGQLNNTYAGSHDRHGRIVGHAGGQLAAEDCKGLLEED